MIKAFNKIDNESKKALTDGIALLAKLSIKNGYEINKPEPKGKLKKKRACLSYFSSIYEL